MARIKLKGKNKGELEEQLPQVSQRLKCGEYVEYKNTSGQFEFVTLAVANRCEFTGYLWIFHSEGRFRVEKVPPGGAYNETFWLPAKGRIEYECSLVRTVQRDGCDFSVAVHRRIAGG
jgi:hypothetical protein